MALVAFLRFLPGQVIFRQEGQAAVDDASYIGIGIGIVGTSLNTQENQRENDDETTHGRPPDFGSKMGNTP
ncbi:MAG: hypothetical protein FD138_4537 [Planctomycetota bacterium]|nr:MAG: hypothetical protein FD138_4537 [Planctomycetota bacterium]